jgi:putative transposase
MRTAQFFNNGYYHLYNRGVDKRKIFLRYAHNKRFIKSIRSILETGSATQRLAYDQSLALKYKVNILAYCLMPNHYHFLVKQIDDNGITDFMHNLNTSYTKYFNLNNKRIGRLFEYTFKAKVIDSDEVLLHVSRYIHLNPLLAGLTTDLEYYPWSSYYDYIGRRKDTFCDLTEILSHFSITTYKDFVNNQAEYAFLLKELEKIKDEDSIFF